MQNFLPCAVLAHIHEAALQAWEKIDADAKFKGGYTNFFQGVSEPCAECIGKLDRCNSRQVKFKETQKHLLKQLTFENANEDYQSILHNTTKEKEDVIR